MATLKEFEESLREHGMHMALALLERLRERDRQTRTIRPARRITGQKMTPDLARAILELHASTGMTQQEIGSCPSMRWKFGVELERPSVRRPEVELL
ncbi:hypothetical protein Mpop_5066 [Methylorubrum populi BJ001]|uniref:Uncharacterized protein n=1 Tax=Methylorubrum populi (strain ATCC BAA-705 / NCIMB 13946 / BJ001) TaxID=441620 RepID=B1Z7T8_METPB|nr:hypothetical protein Mpop_5066 [Methylorubrum populi BJ001]